MGPWEREEEFQVKKRYIVEERRRGRKVRRKTNERYALSLLHVNGVKNIGGVLEVLLQYTHRHLALLKVSEEGT